MGIALQRSTFKRGSIRVDDNLADSVVAWAVGFTVDVAEGAKTVFYFIELECWYFLIGLLHDSTLIVLCVSWSRNDLGVYCNLLFLSTINTLVHHRDLVRRILINILLHHGKLVHLLLDFLPHIATTALTLS